VTDFAGPRHLWIIGAGRVGLALGLLLERAGVAASLTYSGRRATPPDHPLFRGSPAPARYAAGMHLPTGPAPDAVLLAVPDDSIGAVARELAALALPAGTPVLHLSGALGPEVLAPLSEAGCAVGALHPLAAVADGVGGADRLRGAWYALQGEGSARVLGEWIVRTASGRLIPLDAEGKALYHAAAVFASNYVVALLAEAERLMSEAGAPAEVARAAVAELALGAVENVGAKGAAAALTGPVARGDVATVERHLARLSGAERGLYSLLGRSALKLAREAGLDEAAAARLDTVLGENA
jgi:predicted short-subunit dehydrogenase-like oxidoreductase (DUF2520 family)